MEKNFTRSIAVQAFNKWQYLCGSKLRSWPLLPATLTAWRKIGSSIDRKPNHRVILDSHHVPEVDPPFRVSKKTCSHVTHVNELGLEGYGEFEVAAIKQIHSIDVEKGKLKNKGAEIDFRIEAIDTNPDSKSLFTQFAMQPKLIALAKDYLGVQPRLYSVGLWIDYPTDGASKETQNWHRDPDDFICLKIFIYLNDVGSDTGPFSFIPAQFSQKIFGYFGKYRRFATNKRLNDQEMEQFIPRKNWVAVTGKKGSFAAVDTCTCYHRGLKPKSGYRYVFSACYTSSYPRLEW
jgi:hypothetical protein